MAPGSGRRDHEAKIATYADTAARSDDLCERGVGRIATICIEARAIVHRRDVFVLRQHRNANAIDYSLWGIERRQGIAPVRFSEAGNES